MITLAQQILDSKLVEDIDGNARPLSSNTSAEQCEFLQKIIRDLDATVCLEVGLCHGISSLFICEEICDKVGGKLYSIDPYQVKSGSIGLTNLKKAGFESTLEFHEDFSHNVLPSLLSKQVSIDFAYVDTSKLFDTVFVDAYYIMRLLRIGGVVAFDDCTWPGIKKLVRYLTKIPSLKIYDKFGPYRNSRKLKTVAAICRRLPFSAGCFSPRAILPEEDLGVSAHCIAFQKVDEDKRNWDWFADF